MFTFSDLRIWLVGDDAPAAAYYELSDYVGASVEWVRNGKHYAGVVLEAEAEGDTIQLFIEYAALVDGRVIVTTAWRTSAEVNVINVAPKQQTAMTAEAITAAR